MNINLTLIVQMINFLIAYFIITKFFLKPVLDIIKADNLLNQALLSDILQEDQKLIKKYDIKKSNWNKLQNYFFKNRPEVSDNLDFIDVKPKQIERYENLNKDQLNTLVNKISKELESKVVHD